MKVAAMFGKQQGGLVDKPEPQPQGDYVVVEIQAAPMCTEYKAFAKGHCGDIFGHEASGRVAAIAQPGKVAVGDRVAVMPQYPCGCCPLCLQGEYIHCQHIVDACAATGNQAGTATYAQFVLKQDWLLLPLPDEVSYAHGAMACCGLGPTFGAMQRLCVDRFDTVLIAGMGPVGLGGVINGVYRGARIIALEPHPYRARLARQLGAEVVLDPNDPQTPAQLSDLTNGIGADKAIDCSGAPQAQRLLIDGVRRRGEVAFVGEGGDLSITISRDMIRKGLVLRGSWHYNLADAPRLIEIIRSVPDQLDQLITHTFPMSQVQQAWNLQSSGECGKIVLDPHR